MALPTSSALLPTRCGKQRRLAISLPPTSTMPTAMDSAISQIEAGPAADVSAHGEVDLDLLIVEVGVSGSLELVGVGLTGSCSMMPRSATKTTTLRASVSADIESSHGELEIWAKIDLLLWGQNLSQDDLGIHRGPEPSRPGVLAEGDLTNH